MRARSAEAIVADTENLPPGMMEKQLDAAVLSVRKAIASYADGVSIFDLRPSSNNLWVVSVHGLRNRAHTHAIDLFRWLANNLPESYGLLYVRDDDDAKRQNTFTVYRLARGKLDELVDGLLSPCVPTIEAELT
jgi:hypothetical protein